MSNSPFGSPDDFDMDHNPFSSPQTRSNEMGLNGGMYPKTTDERTLNPWTAIWTKPRALIRQLIESGNAQIWPIVILAGVLNGSSQLAGSDKLILEAQGADGAQIAGMFIGALFVSCLVGAAVGAVVFLISSALVHKMGQTLGGVGNIDETRIAMAYAQIPSIWLAPFGILLAAFFLFSGLDLQTIGGMMIAFAVVSLFVGIWQIVIYCKAIGEAHQFSAWRGLGALLLAGLVVIGILFVIGIAFAVLFAALL